MKKISLLLLIISLFVRSEEGMYPLSEIHKLQLKEKGFMISAKDIYNPNGISLVDASVRVGGCSASFVSPEGLIITNHHCVFGAVQQVSSVQNDYIRNGFVARNRAMEIPAKGLTARIIDSYRDVSKDVLVGISDTTDPLERTAIIERNSRKLTSDAQKEHPGVTASIAEMFAGKTYVLFIYKTLKDIRLVYVPPRTVGEFGGENDNWVWPRHTGDFSFIRAYVGPDGNPAEYAADNVPFSPRKYFRINPNGVEENDRVFILGYPGRTFRHQPSFYLEYERDIRLPFIQQRNAWMIAEMEKAGKDDPAVALALSARMKSLANVEKNYRGKMKGFANIPIIRNKKNEEEQLMHFIRSDAERRNKYGTVLSEIKKVYDDMRSDAPRMNVLSNILSSSTLLSIADTVLKFSESKIAVDTARPADALEKKRAQLQQQIGAMLRGYNRSIDMLFLGSILENAKTLSGNQSIEAVRKIVGDGTVAQFVDSAFARSELSDTAFIFRAMEMTPAQLIRLSDPLIMLAFALAPDLSVQRTTERKRSGELNRLMAKLIDVKQEWKKTEFIPDANSTLRLTYGSIRGYSPADAVYFAPITTLKGVIEKSSSDPEYDTPARIRELYGAKDFGKYKSKKLNDLPVAILYDMDTTGGNSGSPVLNAKGELVGVNFDRAFEATINDYAWDQSYSRSIAVDIRYVLWNVEKVGDAGYLLTEMGIR